MTAPPLIRTIDLEVSLGGVSILRGVNMTLPRGRITALIGLNGSGKTTLLRTLLGEIKCRGKVQFFCGHDHSRPSPQHIGYVPQKLRIEAHLPLTVCDLLALTLYRKPLFFGVSGAARKEMADMLTRVFASPSILDRPVEKLSGGELQRVLLALAMQPNPELLLLDEPAAGIDFRHEQMFYDLIARLNKERGVTILLVSHDLTIVSRHADQVVCLKDGKVQCAGTPQEIMRGDMLSETFGADKAFYTHQDHD